MAERTTLDNTYEKDIVPPKTSPLANNVARTILEAYVKLIKTRIDDLDERYIRLGVDHSFNDYRNLCLTIVATLLNLKYPTSVLYPHDVKVELITHLDNAVRYKGYIRYLDNRKICKDIYKWVIYFLDHVERDRFMEEHSAVKN